MKSYTLLAAAAGLSILPSALAHSLLVGVIINGKNYHGYDPRPGAVNPADRVGWLTTAEDQGYVSALNYSTPDIVCHRGGKSPVAHAPVRAGDKVHVQWNGWPAGHQGPVISYVAPCKSTKGDGCTSADKNTLSWTKIENGEPGLFNPLTSPPPGDWASNHLANNNNSWLVGIPTGLKPGPYVLRHEIIALHFAAELGGAQNYPLCINLWVEAPAPGVPVKPFNLAAGIPATKMYKSTDPGILIDIYKTQTTSYVIPGPTVAPNANPVPVTAQTISASTADGVPVVVASGTKTVPFAQPTAVVRRYPRTF
ncbi:glycosyl hydrolase family 61-domain-containing protein [Podospora didyma]|uniref:lytic cellulose monooxygenase (C4-dehydrogenating) n=1 Tax=Podospora didyma TaxID=330526 RepID=A0AAE0K237_9PEZI|nr:glycosyl hydrolase family 61-domain-containing protein [Podospora didyma]